jgi:PAS domain S-box-containing protein
VASLGALLLGVVGGVAVHDHPWTALPGIALGWTVERAYVAIVIQRQARLAAEALQRSVVAIRNSTDTEEVRDQLLAAAAVVLHAGRAAFVDPASAQQPGALRAPIDERTVLEVSDRVGGGAWLDSERDALRTLATVAVATLRNTRLLAHLTAITDGQSEGVLALDSVGVITFANPAARRLLAYDAELLGRRADELFTIETANGRLDLSAPAGGRSGIRDDDALLLAEDRNTPVAFTVARLPAPQTGVVLVLHDITERKAF